MSGHSKWATIKRKKGAADAKRGQLFTKLIKEITVAARAGGGDPSGNPRLRTAIAIAKAGSMPGDNIERAIKKGTGELEGVNYEEVTYEGYGPAGVAMLVTSLTDNKNRTVAEIRNLFSKNGGNMGESGSVGWMFEKKGVLNFDKKTVIEDKLMEAALDAGAEDIQDAEDSWDVVTSPADFEKVKEALEKAAFKPLSAEISMIPKNTIRIEAEDTAAKMLRLMEALEEHDDVQKVYANFDIPAQILEKLSVA
ncbi:MAG: YebC/PmpR family DNA-binding transcriptional regulator [Deltaproteobacteria bacterium]|nr:YebC/PmpR family DNA-binding transcriptional regulator [Deltaproteobacteria bacterium]